MKLKMILLAVLIFSALAISVQAQESDAENVDFAYGNISFRYDASIAAGVEATNVEEVPIQEDMPYWAANPAFTEFFFVDYAGGKDFFHEPRIQVYPTADFGSYVTGDQSTEYALVGQLEQLTALVDNQPDLEEYTALPLDENVKYLPFVPMFNAAQVFRAQPEYLEFQSGTGLRYLTYFSQAVNPITDTEIFYTFQGLTADGAFYISAIFPVTTGIFPEEIDFQNYDFAAFEADYENYMKESFTALHTQSGDAFTPTLAQLDALMQSLTIISE